MLTPSELLELYIPRKQASQYTHKSGSYSTVYIPRDARKTRVVKFNDNFDNGYHYLLWCMEQPAAWKPRVYMVQRADEGYIAIMERCTEVWGQLRGLSPLEMLNKLPGNATEELLAWGKKRISKWHSHIRKYDIHQGNIMLTRRGTLVLTDPLV